MELLIDRHATALARVEELWAEALAVADRLDEARCVLSDLQVARRTLTALLVLKPEPEPEPMPEPVPEPSLSAS